ncbi:MAG: hypothetical protein HY821_19940 [Acidobacteria bacterium]|nr:hypothetical protein [Acidobacteriota bacterium]
MLSRMLLLVSCALLPLAAQEQGASQIKDILDRLEKLEKENRVLRDEVADLRRQVGGEKPPSAPPAEMKQLAERVEVQESRTAELAQTKVEASSRFPISITGMALFNTFYNTDGNGGSQYPTTASLLPTPANGGGSFRQSIVGFRFQGPQIAGGGHVSGSLYTDFWGGTDNSLNHLMRIRTANIQIDWKRTTLMAAHDKPLISPREPNSLAQVAISPLTGAGNPWLWKPQFRAEQRMAIGESAGFRAQGALYMTDEARVTIPSEYASSFEAARPGYQGRFELWKDGPRGSRMELASGFHLSDSHVAGYSVPSRIFSTDWMLKPHSQVDFSGLFFHGQNIAPLGALRQGYVFVNGVPQAVHTTGGYGQLAWRPTSRLSFHLFAGTQDDRNSDLVPGRIGKNSLFGGNTMYRLAPNVIISFEGSQIRTNYIGSGLRTVNHYDIALAYLF